MNYLLWDKNNYQSHPLASLCLGVVRGWINVASKGKGGQIDKKGTAWTRLPADQLKDQLAREFRVEVSTRTVHRALQELSDAKPIKKTTTMETQIQKGLLVCNTQNRGGVASTITQNYIKHTKDRSKYTNGT